jgi:diphosphomevalonate decarboxylase
MTNTKQIIAKSTAVAPSNIAFIKYWGKKDEKLRLPENGSISMNLSNLLTTTTVEFSDVYATDSVLIDGKKINQEIKRVIEHLNRIRKLAKITKKAKVISVNNFSSRTGLSSSASGFAALTVAGTSAAGLLLSEKALTILSRQGSGSSCRSIPDGFVEWHDGDTSKTSYAETIFPHDYWNIIDIVIVCSTHKKEISTTEGQIYASSSPFYETRLKTISRKVATVKKCIKGRDFTLFGELIEKEALELHAIMMTSWPPLLYWQSGTLDVMKSVQKWRKDGLEAYFTINTGQDVHVLTEEKNREKVVKNLTSIPSVRKIIINKPATGTRLINNHLF